MDRDQKKINNILSALNNFTRKDTGVLVHPKNQGLSYSDGDAEEQYIQQVVTSVGDVSSLSEELRSFERDWSSECHLSAKRANVFRALDFTDVRNTLEIGSGCGAITRFLGEQGGRVDAVEGSARRAEITRLRCRGLENVAVYHADFNSLKLPEAHYDLALLTGVLEYAGKFSDKAGNPLDAAVGMLERIIPCIRPGGRLVVAIENRIGFKYLAGASEDHFSRPWVGVSNYPDCDEPDYRDKTGIRTWDRGQWQTILERLPGVSCQWYFPFPDYKLATSLLSEEFIQSTPYAWSCLSRVQSRDYTAVWHSPLDEQLFWQTAAAAHSLEEMSNSFVLVLQRENESGAVRQLVPFDFAHFSGHNRKPEYRIMVQKKKGQNSVLKTRLFKHLEPAAGSIVVQHLEEEPFHEGSLLSVLWADSLRSCSSPLTFDLLLKEYYRYVVKVCDVCGAGGFLDLLPINIIVSDDGEWHHFDQEWQTEELVTPQFILFRAVLYFYWDNKKILCSFCREQHLRNGWEFTKYCLGRLLFTSEFDIQNFVRLENKIQKAISRSGDFAKVDSVLESAPEDVPETWSWQKTTLIWGQDTVTSPPVASIQVKHGRCITFNLPPAVCGSPYIQLSMGLSEQEVGAVFTIHAFNLYSQRVDGGREQFFPTDSDVVMPPLMKLTGLTFFEDVRGGVFTVDEKEPQVLHFLFPEQRDGAGISEVVCEIVVKFLDATGDQIRKEQYGIEKQNLDIQIVERDALIREKMNEVIERDVCIAELEENIAELEEKKHRLREIEESRAWRSILTLRRFQARLTGLFAGNDPPADCTVAKDDGGPEQSEPDGVLQGEDTGINNEAANDPEPAGRRADLVTAEELLEADKDIEQLQAGSLSALEHQKMVLEEEFISVVLAVFNTPPDELTATINSAAEQLYEHWELIIVDAGSTNGATRQALAEIKHPKIKVHYLKKSENLTMALDEGIALVSGDWVTFLGHFDRFSADIFSTVAKVIHEQAPDVVYCDEESIDREGELVAVKEKPDFVVNDLDGSDVIGSSLFIRRSILSKAGGLDSDCDGVQLFDLVLRATFFTDKIFHLNKVLYKVRQFELPGQDELDLHYSRSKRAWDKWKLACQ